MHRYVSCEPHGFKLAVTIDEFGKWRHLKFQFVRDRLNRRELYAAFSRYGSAGSGFHVDHVCLVPISQPSLLCRSTHR